MTIAQDRLLTASCLWRNNRHAKRHEADVTGSHRWPLLISRSRRGCCGRRVGKVRWGSSQGRTIMWSWGYRERKLNFNLLSTLRAKAWEVKNFRCHCLKGFCFKIHGRYYSPGVNIAPGIIIRWGKSQPGNNYYSREATWPPQQTILLLQLRINVVYDCFKS